MLVYKHILRQTALQLIFSELKISESAREMGWWDLPVLARRASEPRSHQHHNSRWQKNCLAVWRWCFLCWRGKEDEWSTDDIHKTMSGGLVWQLYCSEGHWVTLGNTTEPPDQSFLHSLNSPTVRILSWCYNYMNVLDFIDESSGYWFFWVWIIHILLRMWCVSQSFKKSVFKHPPPPLVWILFQYEK